MTTQGGHVPSSVLDDLAGFVCAHPIGDIPEPVREHARALIVDQVGVCLTGSRQEAFRRLLAVQAPLGLDHDGPALVLAADAPRRSPYAAVLLNAAASHLSELGEGVSRAVVHASNAVVPAALAAADRNPVTGEQVLRAVALGCETLIRFGLTVNSPPDLSGASGDVAAAYLGGWWTPIVLSPIGAATAWTLLGGGGPRQLRDAWLTALNSAPATSVSFILGGDSTKGLAMGLGCASGVAAAEVALRSEPDAAAPVEPSDPVTGWLPLLVPEGNPAALVRELGHRWELDYPLYKFFATVGPLHAAVEAVFEILARQSVPHEEVTDILVEGYQRTVQFLGRPRPGTAEEAKTSLCHALAVAVVTGSRDTLLHDAFEPDLRGDGAVAAVAGKVRAVCHPVFDEEYPRRSARSRVTISLANGDRHVCEVDRDALPRYHRPSRVDITDKFVAATAHAWPEAEARHLADLLWSVQELPLARHLTDSIAGVLAGQHPAEG
jgi:2-methylcitrate dehydratase PrpD